MATELMAVKGTTARRKGKVVNAKQSRSHANQFVQTLLAEPVGRSVASVTVHVLSAIDAGPRVFTARAIRLVSSSARLWPPRDRRMVPKSGQNRQCQLNLWRTELSLLSRLNSRRREEIL